jgi:prepilin-type N-terminal cleavage/methylation domain-containing protein
MKILRNRLGFTLVELLFAVAVTSLVIAGATAGILSLQRSFARSKQYAYGMNDASRLVDYVSRDLRNAVKISRRTSGVATRLGSGTLTPFEVTDVNELVLFVPDYFVSNVPDNSSGSDYKRSRFNRSGLPLANGQTYFNYNDIITVVGSSRLPKYPGFLEIRYLKKARSPQDATLCFFRQEYEGSTLRLEREIADKVESSTLTIVPVEDDKFQIVGRFSPKWASDAARDATRQFSTVKLPNRRRD